LAGAEPMTAATITGPPTAVPGSVSMTTAEATVAALRQQGIPARSRIGFVNYFAPDFHHDHVIAGPIQSAYPPMGASILVPALIVVVVGGLGSLKGSLAGSLIIGQAETFGKVWLPGSSMVIIYVVMALVLLFRPQGLFGRALK